MYRDISLTGLFDVFALLNYFRCRTSDKFLSHSTFTNAFHLLNHLNLSDNTASNNLRRIPDTNCLMSGLDSTTNHSTESGSHSVRTIVFG